MDLAALHVLIVDDSPEDRLTLRRLLTQTAPGAYTITEVDCGDRALAACQESPPDCILLDYRLPDMDGLALLTTLRAQRDVPVVLLTGVGTETLAVDALQRGAQDYLVKASLTPERLRLTIQHAIATVRLARERDQTLALLSTMLDTLPVGIIVLDGDLHVHQVNPALARVLGQPAAALHGQALSQLWPEAAAALAEPCAQVLGGAPFSDRELHLPASAGSAERWLSLSGTPIRDPIGGNLLALLTMQDITARRQAADAAQAATMRLQVLALASDTFAEVATDESAMLRRVARLAAEPLAANCLIRLRSADSAWLQTVAVYDCDPALQAILNTVVADVRIPIDAPHPAAAVLRSGQPLLIAVIDPEAVRPVIAPALWREFERVQPHSQIIVPLQAHGQILGCLAFTRHTAGRSAFTADDLTMAQDLADRAALAIHNVRLYQQTQAAQQAAAESLARLDALITSIPSGVGYLDCELRYQLINPALAAINDRPIEDHLGRTPAELLPGLAPRLEPIMRQVLATGAAVCDLELHGCACPTDGVERDWLISYFPVRGPGDTVIGVGVTVTDVTVSERTAAALRESELRYRLLFETMAQGVVYQDTGGQIIAANPAAERILGLTLSQLQGRTSVDPRWRAIHEDGSVFPGDEHPAMVVLRSGQEVRDVVMGVYHPGKDAYRWISIQAVPTFRNGESTPALVYTIFTDITERRAAQRALEHERQQLAAILDTMHEGMIAARPNGTLALINPAALAMRGFDPAHPPATLDDLVQQTAQRARDVEGQALGRDAWPMHRALGGERFAGMELNLRPTHSEPERWQTFNGAPVYDENGALTLGIVTGQDITQHKRAELALAAHADALSRSNAELTRALKLKDEFLAMMSHELRTPLNVILGYTEGLLEDVYGPLAEPQRRALDQVSTSGRHLLAILSDILDLAHLEGGRSDLVKESVGIDNLCRAATHLVAVAAQQKGIELSRTVSVGVEAVRADERRLTQILVNLLDNAIKFTPAGGRIGLEVTAHAAQEQLAFTVWDTGIGIAEADYARLFQPFTQLDAQLSRAYEGIGLGLSLVRRLVDLHGGSIQLASAPGQGSRFTVSLPWSAEDNVAPPATRAPIRQAPAWITPPRLVIADDHETTLTFYRDRLGQEGCAVTVARTGAEAVAQVRATRPDVAVLDIQMPGMDGLTAIRQIRADPEVGATPIIALTALAMPGDRERCLEAGANVYLAKPVSVHTLLVTITELLTDSAPGR